jgi:hypothetical protein
MPFSWILCHLVGDFFIQTDWMARNKRVKPWVCAMHAVTYALPFILVGISPLQGGLTAFTHYAVDVWGLGRWFMKHTGHEEFATGPLAPWSIVLTDQIIHLLCLQAIFLYVPAV